MRNMQFKVLFAASTILSVLSLSTPFMWRGNVLRLKKEPLSKDDQFVVPFKLDNSEVIEEDVGVTDGKEGNNLDVCMYIYIYINIYIYIYIYICTYMYM
jgi:hypothetical protein